MMKSLTNKLYLKRQLYGLNMVKGTNLLEQINVFNKLLDQLSEVDVKVDKVDKALLFLILLPNSYDNLVTMLLFRKDIVSLKDIIASLLSYKIRRIQNLKGCQEFGLIGLVENCKGMPFVKEFKNNRFRFKSREKGKVQCFYYKKYGHMKMGYP